MCKKKKKKKKKNFYIPPPPLPAPPSLYLLDALESEGSNDEENHESTEADRRRNDSGCGSIVWDDRDTNLCLKTRGKEG